jgi:DNA processing protein
MTRSGGLLTDLRSGTAPDKQNFPKRNRIVAGIADAVVVVETDIKGGSMITAELANNYNKDVFAIPGKVTDVKSAGCNYLIRSNKAALATSGKDILEYMNWSNPATTKNIHQKKLFIDLAPEEKKITEMLSEQASVHIDEINLHCGLSSSSIAAAMLHLELEGIIIALPGKHYKLS